MTLDENCLVSVTITTIYRRLYRATPRPPSVVSLGALFLEIKLKKKQLHPKSMIHNINGHNYYLLTGCKGRTRKYKPKVFIQPELARAVWKTKGLYFLVRHEHPVSK